jgi:two-component system sensor histidine kinase and response regulator WspE
MLELFRVEAENQAAVLTSALLALERSPSSSVQFEILMRAAHSMKGAARIINLPAVVRMAHAMEDCFVASQHGKMVLDKAQIDILLRGVDLLAQLAKRTDVTLATWETEQASQIQDFLAHLQGHKHPESDLASSQVLPAPTPAGTLPPGDQSPASAPGVVAGSSRQVSTPDSSKAVLPETSVVAPVSAIYQVFPASEAGPFRQENPERVVRLNAENLNRLLGLAGESLVESRWLRPFADSLQRLKRHHVDLAQNLDRLQHIVQEDTSSDRCRSQFHELLRQLAESQQFLAERLQELNLFDRRSAHLSHRLYLEVLRTRMRPFGEGVRRFPRMVRDLARSLGKEVKLEITGDSTQVDRDILERLETPLAHLLRNCVDHGCELPDQRARAGKSPECVIHLDARHSAGMLLVTVADDGKGVSRERVREAIVQKRLTLPAVAEKLTESELMEFLFLPGFTLKDTVSEISGRGVGLDVVQNLVKGLRGSIRLANQPGHGLKVQLQLPLTLSVLRALLVEVAGEPYAIPLTQISRTLKLPSSDIQSLEGRLHFQFAGQQIGLIAAHQVFECRECKPPRNDLPVVIFGDHTTRYGLVVDRFLGERELVVQPLDPRLGKVTDISAAALMEDGAPVLIIDVDELMRSIEKLISAASWAGGPRNRLVLAARRPQRVLAVDDSLTVRELVRKLLASRGYLAEVAVDGLDAWNAVRAGHFDLVLTDVDMPRMDGIELTTLMKKDPRLKSIPVLIVSYKDREEDRMRGLEAGADYYLTKGSFHDETLLQAIADLIGEPES